MAKQHRKKMRELYGPDLQELGDPWADPESLRDERPDEEWTTTQHRQLDAMIASVPAGGLSGGQRMMDPGDPTTWSLSDDPAEAAFAEQLYGKAEDLRDGLNHNEKRALYEQGLSQIERTSQKDIDKAEKGKKKNARGVEDVWAAFQADYPHLTDDFEGLQRAGQRVLKQWDGDVKTLRRLLKRNPSAVTGMIADAYFDTQADGPAEPEPANVFGGGRGHTPARGDHEERGDIMSEIAKMQKKSGLV